MQASWTVVSVDDVRHRWTHILWQDDHYAPCADSDIEGEEMYDDMLTTDQMIQMLEEDDSD